MKRIISIALIQIYLLLTVGFSMEIHHCSGKTSFEVFGLNFNKQCKCKHQIKIHSSNCCHDEHVFIKTTDGDKILSKTTFVKIEQSLKCPFQYIETRDFGNLSDNIPEILKPDYPPRYSTPIFLLNRILLI